MIAPKAQMPLRLWLEDDAHLDNFYPGKGANIELVNYLKANQPDLLYLFGPASCGVSHLLFALCKRAEQQGRRVQYIPLQELVAEPSEMLSYLGEVDFLCVDNIEAIKVSNDWQQALFNLYNQIRDQGGTVLFGAHIAPTELSIDLADLRSRVLAGEVWSVQELSDEDKMIALQKRAESRGFSLSDQVARYLINHKDRDMSSLMDLLSRLDRLSLEQKKLITLPFVKNFL